MSFGNSDLISLGATAIALIALVVSIVEATANRPRLRRRYYMGQGVGTIEGDWLIVSVINWGRQPTTISHVSIELPGLTGADGRPCHAVHLPSNVLQSTPHFLEVGREAKFAFNLSVTVANVTSTDQAVGTLRELARQFGAVARISTTWHTREIRMPLKAAF